MKRIIAMIAILVLLVSCGTTRKASESRQTSYIDSMTVQQVETKDLSKIIDTTRTEHGKVTITEIEFFPPPPPILEDAKPRKLEDSPKKVENTDESKPTKTADVEMPGVGKVKGAVKSIKQTVIESDVEEKGESKESEKQEQCKSEANAIREESDIQLKESPAPDPYRWRYAFYLSLLCVAVLLYLKRTPILNWIKKILAGIRRIF